MENSMTRKWSKPRTMYLHLGAFQRRREDENQSCLDPRYTLTIPSSPRPFRHLALPERALGGSGRDQSTRPHSLKRRGGLSPPQFKLTPSEGEAALREMKRSLPTPFTARKHQPKSWPWRVSTNEAKGNGTAQRAKIIYCKYF